MNEIELHNPSYPMLHWVVRYGETATLFCAAATFIFALYAAWMFSNSAIALGGLGLSALIYLIGRTLSELVRLVTDMLLPK
jgi:hypothetical protein